MKYLYGIRREDKNEFEKRVPIVPHCVRTLSEQHHLEAIVQPSRIRAFSEEEFESAGARISESLKEAPVIFAVKEMPIDFFERNKTYIFFSHVIKGQKHNMPMLKRMIDLGCNLIDYEKVTDKNGKRLIFFGRFAGLAGMIDSLWAFGKRLESQGMKTPFSEIKKALDYSHIEEAKEHIKKIGEEIKIYGFDSRLSPLVCVFLGYGHVAGGAKEIFDLLPNETIKPEEIITLKDRPNISRNLIYKVIFKEEDLVRPINEKDRFDLKEYYGHPERYRPKLEQYIEHIQMIINCIYWDSRYPRFVTKDYLKGLFNRNPSPVLKILGDISCDILGSIECNVECTTSGDPVYVYDPATEKIRMGVDGRGVVVLAVDNLPCELPQDSSEEFSRALLPFIPSIVKADYSKNFKGLDLPPEIKKAMILHQGRLTPDYQYISKYF